MMADADRECQFNEPIGILVSFSNIVYDVIIVGGGPAGLNAALVPGRVQRSVLLCDAGEPRNRQVRASHGLLTRDGTSPTELRRIGADQLGPYPTVERRRVTVDRIDRDGQVLRSALSDGGASESRRVILATGVPDLFPAVEGLAERWGTSVFNCPYCDGWEVRGQPIAVLSVEEQNIHLALMLSRFSAGVVLCTNGAEISGENVSLLRQRGVEVVDATPARLEGPDFDLEGVVCSDGSIIGREVRLHSSPNTSSIVDTRPTRSALARRWKRRGPRPRGTSVVGSLPPATSLVAPPCPSWRPDRHRGCRRSRRGSCARPVAVPRKPDEVSGTS